MDYQIISTGSKGNAVVIGQSILIDCGVPFRALQEAYQRLQLVLLTHIHQDHFNRSSIKRLAKERPTLRFGCCEWLVEALLDCGVAKRNIDVYQCGIAFVYSGFCTIKPEKLLHNVPNCGYHIWKGAEALFYATDTNSLKGTEARDYDLYMIEANYEEEEIMERIQRKQEAGEYCHEWDVLKNHLSKEKADDWLYSQMGARSRYVYLHEHEERFCAE